MNLIYSLWSDSLHENMTFNNNTVLFFFTYRKHKGQSLVCDESVYSEDSGNVHWNMYQTLLIVCFKSLFYNNNDLDWWITSQSPGYKVLHTPSTDYKMICGICGLLGIKIHSRDQHKYVKPFPVIKNKRKKEKVKLSKKTQNNNIFNVFLTKCAKLTGPHFK